MSCASRVLLSCSLLLVLAAAPALNGQSRAAAGAVVPAFAVVERSIEDLQRKMTAGEVTSRQLVDAYLARIEAYDQQGPRLNAIIAINPQARAAAAALDAERAAGKVRGPLHGIPILVKDNYETIEMPTGAGSIALAGFHPERDAFQVKRLKDAGAVILGKTNMHELAAGITTVGSLFGQTRNPYDLDRNPGGSSGGTGAAVAANFAAAGMGSDTCGSIRNPASHNNLVGVRGTQGLSSRAGIVPLSSTQDIGGPIARSIVDLALVLDATVGPDPADASTAGAAAHIPASYRAGLRADALSGARIGVLRSQFGGAPEDQEVTAVVQKALDAMKKAGAEVVDVTVPGLDELLQNSSMINADFKFDLMEYFAGAPNPPVASLGEILDRGLYHTALEATFRARNGVERRDSDQARRARIKRDALRHAIEATLAEQQLTALVYPTLRRKPARIGDAQIGSTCQVSAHSGLPALSVPAGFSADDVPIGMDLLGSAWSEGRLLSLGYAIEQLLRLRRAPFSTPELIEGKAPSSRAFSARHGATTVAMTWNPTTSELSYTVIRPATPDALRAVWLHTSADGKPGAARYVLWRRADAPRAGVLTLSAADRQALDAGRLLLRFYAEGTVGSAADVPLK